MLAYGGNKVINGGVIAWADLAPLDLVKAAVVLEPLIINLAPTRMILTRAQSPHFGARARRDAS